MREAKRISNKKRTMFAENVENTQINDQEKLTHGRVNGYELNSGEKPFQQHCLP